MFLRYTWLGPVALAIAITGPANSQSPAFAGPVPSLVYSHSSRTIRPLLGVPGATYVGPSVMNDLDSASISPDGAWAFITRSHHGALVGGLSQLTPATVSISGLIEGANLVAWSRNASYALLYSAAGQQLQLVQFSSAGPSADAPLSLAAWGKATTLAIDPTGQRIAFGVPGSGLYLFNAGQSPVQISSMAQPAAIAFDDTGLHLYAADLAQQQITGFDSSGAPSLFASLATANGSPVNPVGLAVSAGGEYLLLADSASRAVLVYGIASQELTNSIPLASAPSGMQALTTGPSYLLNGGNPQESLLILDARQTPSVYFVPAIGEARQ